MIEVTLEEAIQAMRATVLSPEADGEALRKRFPRLSIDSRTLRAGESFFAIQGARLDGHRFIPEALEKGAGVIVASSRPPSGAARAVVLLVDDTTRALQDLARYMRLKWGRPLVAVTGSAGKTTTRSFTASLLSRKYKVHSSPGNLNNDWGVPLSLGRLEEDDEIAVQELGMNRPGEIRRLSHVCRPDAAVITNVAPAHTEFFEDLEALADAKAEVLEALPSGGTFYFNADDRLVRARAERFQGRAVGFGLGEVADVRIADPRLDSPNQTGFHLEARGKRVPARVGFSGLHNLYNAAAAAAVALGYGLSVEEAAEELGRLSLMAMRGEILDIAVGGGEPLRIWDDSYNSNPAALASVLETLPLVTTEGRRVLALGDMLELGSEAARYHRQAGARAAQADPDLLVTVGELAEDIARGAVETGLPEQKIARFPDSESAGAFLAERLGAGDFLLVKGSRGMKMERIVEAVRDKRKPEAGRLGGIESSALLAVAMFLAVLVSALAAQVS